MKNAFLVLILSFVILTVPALACPLEKPVVIDDLDYADAVVIGRVSGHDEEFYRINLLVDEVISGSVPDAVRIVWRNSWFGQPKSMEGTYLIALRKAGRTEPERFQSIPEGQGYTILQEHCGMAFIFSDNDPRRKDMREYASKWFFQKWWDSLSSVFTGE